jgi:hypothetical protein
LLVFYYLSAIQNPNKALCMIIYNCILLISAIATAACLYYYFKEKTLLRHFIQHSRRHSYNKDIDTSIQQRAKRYLNVCLILLSIMLPLLIQNFVDGFIENNWKWIASFLFIPLAIIAYKNRTDHSKKRPTKWLGVNFTRNAAER